MAGKKNPAAPERTPHHDAHGRQGAQPHPTRQPGHRSITHDAAARPDPAINAMQHQMMADLADSFEVAEYISAQVNLAISNAKPNGVNHLKAEALGRYYLEMVRERLPTLHLSPRFQTPHPISPPTSPPQPAQHSPPGELRDSRWNATPAPRARGAKPAAQPAAQPAPQGPQKPQQAPQQQQQQPQDTPFQPVVNRRQRKVATPQQQARKSPEKEDSRVLLQFPPENSELLQLPGSMAALRKLIIEAGQIDDRDLIAIRQTKTGAAVTPKNAAARQKIFRAEDAIRDLTGATSLQGIQSWHVYVVHNVPDMIADVGVTDSMVRREAENRARQTATLVRSGTPHNHIPHIRTWTVAFEGKVEHRFRLFETSTVARAQKQQQKINQCSNCWGFHLTHHCQHPKRCRKCGQIDAHEECTERCRNCSGPHHADLRSCPARPKRIDGVITPPSKAQLGPMRARHAADRIREQQEAPEPEPTAEDTPEETSGDGDLQEGPAYDDNYDMEEFHGFPSSQDGEEPQDAEPSATPMADDDAPPAPAAAAPANNTALAAPAPQPDRGRDLTPLQKRREEERTSRSRSPSGKRKVRPSSTPPRRGRPKKQAQQASTEQAEMMGNYFKANPTPSQERPQTTTPTDVYESSA